MYRYKAFGMNICSEIFLPELAARNFDKSDLIIRTCWYFTFRSP